MLKRKIRRLRISSKKRKVGQPKLKQLDVKSLKNPKALLHKIKLHKANQARKRAEYLATLPKNPIKRFFYRLHPKRVWGFFTSWYGISLTLKIVGVIVAVIFIFVLAVFAYYRKDLPDIENLTACSEGASTLYYDRTGETQLWASSGDVECIPVKLDQIADYLKLAVIAVEDKDFYHHGGFSITGFIRAGFNNLFGKTTQGGSTLTQQYVKNSLLTQERSFERKLKELILSIEMERTYSKDTILNAYLNEIPFGSVFYGAEAAARGYFGKPASELTLDEAAMLAAIIPQPTYYLPTGSHTDELVWRQHYVLDLMKDQGYIDQETVDKAKEVDTLAKIIPTSNKYSNIIAPHFVLAVQEMLEKEYGVTNVATAGFKVITTIDLTQQKYAEDAIANNMYKIEADGGDNAALVSVDVATGQVLAEVGSRDFNYPEYGELNVAITPRSPGSSFKPYDYASLMTNTQHWGAGSTIYDLVTNFGGIPNYRPQDYDFQEPGALSVRRALGGSRNIPAIKAMYMAGIENTLDLAHKLGIVSGTSCEPYCGLSSAIGDGSEIRLDEHVNSFATFSRMGKYKPLTYILKIEDANGNTIKEWRDTEGEQVLDPQVAYIINNMLSDDSARYIRGSSNFNLPGITTALKTGTTNGMDNGWLLMYSTKIAAGVWIGDHENTAMWCGRFGCMEGKTGSIIAEYMRNAHVGIEGSDARWAQPDGIKTVCIDRITGYATTSGGECDIFPSWYISRTADTTKTAVIDIISNRLATECTPTAARKEITGGGILPEIPETDPLYSNWMQPVIARYGAQVGGAIPTESDNIHSCDDSDLPSINVVEPVSYDDITGEFAIKVNVSQGKYPLSYNGRTSTVYIRVNGTTIAGGVLTINAGGETAEVLYEPADSEPFTITAEIVDSVLYSNSSSAVDVDPDDY